MIRKPKRRQGRTEGTPKYWKPTYWRFFWLLSRNQETQGGHQLPHAHNSQTPNTAVRKGTLSGISSEMVEGFLVRIEREAIVNGWNYERKRIYFPMYLSKTVAVVCDNMERKNPELTWPQIREEFSKSFSPVESNNLLLLVLWQVHLWRKVEYVVTSFKTSSWTLQQISMLNANKIESEY